MNGKNGCKIENKQYNDRRKSTKVPKTQNLRQDINTEVTKLISNSDF